MSKYRVRNTHPVAGLPMEETDDLNVARHWCNRPTDVIEVLLSAGGRQQWCPIIGGKDGQAIYVSGLS